MTDDRTFTVFDETRRIFRGGLQEAQETARRLLRDEPGRAILIYDDASGRLVDVDLRPGAAPASPPRRRGRPKLGVVAREVTLLPRQWEWLAAQPGGASVALRRLVEQARRSPEWAAAARRDAAFRFMQSMAGDREGFEEAVRSLYAGDRPRFEAFMRSWPAGISEHAVELAFGRPASFPPASPAGRDSAP